MTDFFGTLIQSRQLAMDLRNFTMASLRVIQDRMDANPLSVDTAFSQAMVTAYVAADEALDVAEAALVRYRQANRYASVAEALSCR